MDVEDKRPTGRARLGITLIIVALVAIGLVVGMFIAASLDKPGLPKNVAQDVAFEAFLPDQLPGNYAIDRSTFSVKDGVLLYSAKDGTGAVIVITEQARPKNFNLTDFHASLKDAHTLSNVPYSSVTGTNGAGRVLSVTADNTWVLVTTQAPLNQHDMQTIAQSLHRARK